MSSLQLDAEAASTVAVAIVDYVVGDVDDDKAVVDVMVNARTTLSLGLRLWFSFGTDIHVKHLSVIDEWR